MLVKILKIPLGVELLVRPTEVIWCLTPLQQNKLLLDIFLTTFDGFFLYLDESACKI